MNVSTEMCPLRTKPQMKYIHCLNKTDSTKSDAWMSALKCALLEQSLK